MAINIKKHDEIINSIDIAESHDKRLTEVRNRRFADNDRATVESIMLIYDENKEKLIKGSDDEQVMLLSTLHAQREFMGWFIGEALSIIDKTISEGKKNDYTSLNDWIDKNSDRLGFSKRSAYEYMQIRETTTLDQFKKLGVKKALVIAQVKDDKKREAVAKVVSERRLDVAATREYVNDLFTREKEKARKVSVEKKETAMEEVKISIIKAGPDSVMVKTSRAYSEELMDVLNSEIDKLKVKIYERWKERRGR